jgi:hypothetical protein
MRGEQFHVKQRPVGPAGWIDYFEDDRSLAIPSEPISDGFAIRMPSDDDWKAFCEREAAEWAIDRREIIIERIIEEMKKRYKTRDVSLDDNYWISVHFGPLFNIKALLQKLKILKG